jgi:hypothetical protein
LARYLPHQVLHQLMQMALRYLQLAGRVSWAAGERLELVKLRIVPRLHSSQPCCVVPFERHYKSVQEANKTFKNYNLDIFITGAKYKNAYIKRLKSSDRVLNPVDLF